LIAALARALAAAQAGSEWGTPPSRDGEAEAAPCHLWGVGRETVVALRVEVDDPAVSDHVTALRDWLASSSAVMVGDAPLMTYRTIIVQLFGPEYTAGDLVERRQFAEYQGRLASMAMSGVTYFSAVLAKPLDGHDEADLKVLAEELMTALRQMAAGPDPAAAALSEQMSLEAEARAVLGDELKEDPDAMGAPGDDPELARWRRMRMRRGPGGGPGGDFGGAPGAGGPGGPGGAG
jgi:hypothetical protein